MPSFHYPLRRFLVIIFVIFVVFSYFWRTQVTESMSTGFFNDQAIGFIYSILLCAKRIYFQCLRWISAEQTNSCRSCHCVGRSVTIPPPALTGMVTGRGKVKHPGRSTLRCHFTGKRVYQDSE